MSKNTMDEGLDEAEAGATKKKPPANPVKEAILKLVHEKGVGGVVSPTQVARLVSEEKWQRVLKDVRGEAVRLMKSGHVTIYRKGRPVENTAHTLFFIRLYSLGL